MSLQRRRSSDRPRVGSTLRMSKSLTLLLRLHNRGPSMTALSKTQAGAKKIRCRYLHPANGQRQLNPAVELGRLEEAEGQGKPVGGSVVFIDLDP